MNSKEAKLIKQLEKIPTSILSDELNRGQIMDPQIYRYNFSKKKRIAGFAFTVDSMAGCNWGTHIALYKAESRHILIIDGKSYQRNSVWGGLQSYVARLRKIRAVIIDGTFRDIDEIKRLRYCICARGITSAGPHKGWQDRLQVPISCGGVVVCPEDAVVIDGDGIVVIPRVKSEEIIRKAKNRIKMENDWKKRINNGETFYKILNLDKNFK